jgi:hypothetical protein
MSGSERQRRYLERLLAKASQPLKEPIAAQVELDRARARIAELEKALAQRDTTQENSAIASLTKSEARLKSEIATLKRLLSEQRSGSQGQLKVRPRQEFGEVDKLRADIRKLKADISKLKAMLQEEPDVAKLRKKIVDQQVEMAAMRHTMKEIAKERGALLRRVSPSYREARALLTGRNYRVIMKALHPDRSQLVSSDELDEAQKLVGAIKPLFIEKEP